MERMTVKNPTNYQTDCIVLIILSSFTWIALYYTFVSIFSNLMHGLCGPIHSIWWLYWRIPSSPVQWRYVWFSERSVYRLAIVEVVLEWPASWLLIEILFRPTLLVISIKFVFLSRAPLWTCYTSNGTPHFCKTWFSVIQTTHWNVCGLTLKLV